MKKSFLFITICLTLAAGCNTRSPAQLQLNNTYSPAFPSVLGNMASLYDKTLQVKDKTLSVQVMTTPADVALGLSGRSSMADSEGMLFDFTDNANKRPGFWMKGMLFDLDLIWIRDNKIVGITSGVHAPVENWKLSARGGEMGNLPLYYPPSEIDSVLEVNAGWTEKNKIKIGDEVRLVN